MQGRSDAQVMDCYRAADNGWKNHRRKSRRHYHDWTIYRNCCIREMRKRGLHFDLGT